PELEPNIAWPQETGVSLVDRNGRVVAASRASSLLSGQSVQTLWPEEEISGPLRLFVPGVVTGQAMQELKERLQRAPCEVRLVIGNALNMLMTPDLEHLAACTAELADLGLTLAARKTAPLLALTVNPTYHAYDVKSGKYSFQSIDPEELKRAVAQSSAVPVLNVVEDGPEALYEQISHTFWSCAHEGLS
ncbi:MAG: hypothetical protein LBH94_07215, partial [Deltaproteobacteria bacterium]|nr:hypothetical protein [Deltaproteobacteria bacterium]